MPRTLALIFIAGLLTGIAGTIVVRGALADYLPSVFGGMEDIQGRVSGKLREDDRLLLTVETGRGNVLATFTERVQEIDLLVSTGDTLVLSVPAHAPFVQNPVLERVASPVSPAGATPSEAPPEH